MATRYTAGVRLGTDPVHPAAVPDSHARISMSATFNYAIIFVIVAALAGGIWWLATQTNVAIYRDMQQTKLEDRQTKLEAAIDSKLTGMATTTQQHQDDLKRTIDGRLDKLETRFDNTNTLLGTLSDRFGKTEGQLSYLVDASGRRR